MAKLTEEQRRKRALTRARRAALEVEEDDRRSEERRRQWDREGTRLTLEEYRQGVPCRSCGELLQDGRGSWPPLLRMTEEERAEFELQDAAFRERHADCRSVARWTIQGSRTVHCCVCCPPAPMSTHKIEELSALFSTFKPADPKNLDAWDLLLTCDHSVQKAQHKEHDYWSGRVADCPACGTRRGIVTSTRIGPANDPQGGIERERIAAEIRAETAKLERARKAVAKVEVRLEELEVKLAQLN